MDTKWIFAFCSALLVIGTVVTLSKPSSSYAQNSLGFDQISFNRDIRPILSDNCFACHGQDKGSREAGLALHDRDLATQILESGATAIIPGDPENSELIKRVTHIEPSQLMPPTRTEKMLTDEQIHLLKEWINQGAEYEEHWAYIPPERPEVPRVTAESWPANSIDNFVLAELEARGLTPSPEADRRTLIRRLSLDLIGLPPTPDEIDAYLSDERPGAYERLVDRLMASPHYGERMALRWLDVARFADTNGYHSDNPRALSPYRWGGW